MGEMLTPPFLLCISIIIKIELFLKYVISKTRDADQTFFTAEPVAEVCKALGFNHLKTKS